MQGAQATFVKGAQELSRGVDPTKLKAGIDMADAVKSVAEKAQASAKQGKSGWQLGAKVTGSPSGGVSGSIVFTWVF
jgi:hypothetical protein